MKLKCIIIKVTYYDDHYKCLTWLGGRGLGAARKIVWMSNNEQKP